MTNLRLFYKVAVVVPKHILPYVTLCFGKAISVSEQVSPNTKGHRKHCKCTYHGVIQQPIDHC